MLRNTCDEFIVFSLIAALSRAHWPTLCKVPCHVHVRPMMYC